MVGEFGPWHLLIVLVLFVALFGYRKLPDSARSIGRSLRILKSELHAVQAEDPQVDGPDLGPGAGGGPAGPAGEPDPGR